MVIFKLEELELSLEHLKEKSCESKQRDVIEKFTNINDLDEEMEDVEEFREKITAFTIMANKSMKEFHGDIQLCTLEYFKRLNETSIVNNKTEKQNIKLPKLNNNSVAIAVNG